MTRAAEHPGRGSNQLSDKGEGEIHTDVGRMTSPLTGFPGQTVGAPKVDLNPCLQYVGNATNSLLWVQAKMARISSLGGGAAAAASPVQTPLSQIRLSRIPGIRLLRSSSWLAVLLLFCTSSAFAQSGKISGRVTDGRSGEGLPGVNIVIEGTTQGTATDLDGYYVILNVTPGTYALRATFIGFTPEVVQGVRVRSIRPRRWTSPSKRRP